MSTSIIGRQIAEEEAVLQGMNNALSSIKDVPSEATVPESVNTTGTDPNVNKEQENDVALTQEKEPQLVGKGAFDYFSGN